MRSRGTRERTVAGYVSASGNVVTGDTGGGFIVTRTATGDYTITFAKPFAKPPVVVVGFATTASTSGGVTGGSAISAMSLVTAQTCRVFMFVGAAAADAPFTFTAVGVD